MLPAAFVDETMDVVEVTRLKGALVGLPGDNAFRSFLPRG